MRLLDRNHDGVVDQQERLFPESFSGKEGEQQRMNSDLSALRINGVSMVGLRKNSLLLLLLLCSTPMMLSGCADSRLSLIPSQR